jgi:translation initiation factor 3 subunit J
MADNWDEDSDDDWDVEDDELEARLGKLATGEEAAPVFNDEDEDLAVKEKARADQFASIELKKKGNALAEKKRKEEERLEEEELARKAIELEADMEANMTVEERRLLAKQRIEEADNALTDDLFGGVDRSGPVGVMDAGGKAMGAGDTVVLKDLKDHLKHARKVGQCLKAHGKIHLAAAFLKEVIQESKDALDDNAIAEIISICNVIKNEKVAASKKKVKGQAQKSAKRDKAAENKAKKLAAEMYGDNDNYDAYDEMGGAYEDDFF